MQSTDFEDSLPGGAIFSGLLGLGRTKFFVLQLTPTANAETETREINEDRDSLPPNLFAIRESRI